MEIRKLVLNSGDGVVDVTYEVKSDVYRLASFESPSQRFKEAVEEAQKQTEIALGFDAISLGSVSFGREGVHVEFTLGFKATCGSVICKVAAPKLGYRWDENDEIKATGGATIGLVTAIRNLEACAESYVKGERAQGTLEFEEAQEA